VHECRLLVYKANLCRFRWAALQIQDLRRLRIVRAYDVLKILCSLPRSLNATYDRILARIDPIYRTEALTALEWLVFARRPLFLEEVAEASVIDRSSRKIIDPDRQLDPSDIADMLVGLVIVEPELKETTAFLPNTHMISLAHFSVQEYLTAPDTVAVDSHSWFLEASLAHSNIALNCIAYIRYCYTCTISNLAKIRPLESYALHRWTQHAALFSIHPTTLGGKPFSRHSAITVYANIGYNIVVSSRALRSQCGAEPGSIQAVSAIRLTAMRSPSIRKTCSAIAPCITASSTVSISLFDTYSTKAALFFLLTNSLLHSRLRSS
jgi:hypothetical protein